MSNLPQNAGLPNVWTRILIGAPVAVLGAALMLFLLEVGAASLVA